MIIQSLVSLYDRLWSDKQAPPFGFSVEDIGFTITLNLDGDIIGEPQDLRNKISAIKYEYFESIVPYSNQINVRSSNAATTANFMVDKADYIFGMSGNSNKEVHHESFKKVVRSVCNDSKDPGAEAVINFLEKWNSENATQLKYWKEMCGMYGKWIAFNLENERGFIHERPEIQTLWLEYIEKQKFKNGRDFVTGQITDIQPQYAQFKFGSGASLVSFNERSYESYSKSGGENAPIGVISEFKSSTALKWLLRNKNQRTIIGDATTVFWTENESIVEQFMGFILNPRDVTAENNEKLKYFLKAAQQGTKPAEIQFEKDTKFYILGLALNKARLAVRFWNICTIEQLKNRIGKHFNDLEMERSSEKDILHPGIWHLLKETARETKDISPVLGGSLMRSILEGVNYPQNLYTSVLNRIRADHHVNYLKVSILKAVLKRNFNKEVPMSLDLERRESAYLLGRLFAVLEKAQLDALGKINATIKDRFFSAASSTPASVFPRLLRLSQHHIEKAEYGHTSEKRIAEIMENINSFPTHMNLQEQGLFAIAYYQQKNHFYKKQESKIEEAE